MNSPRLLLASTLLLALTAARGVAAIEPGLEKRLPLKPEIRAIFDRSCTFCHGEVVNGEREVRGDLDLSDDAKIKETLTEIGRLKQYIAEDKMPQKPRLSRRLRTDEAAQAKLTKLKADYEKSGDKEVLLKWLDDVVATTGEKKH